MQIITQNGHQRQKYMPFFRHIFGGMHHNDVKCTHNIFYMVLLSHLATSENISPSFHRLWQHLEQLWPGHTSVFLLKKTACHYSASRQGSSTLLTREEFISHPHNVASNVCNGRALELREHNDVRDIRVVVILSMDFSATSHMLYPP